MFSSWPGYRPNHHWELEGGKQAGDVKFTRSLGILERRFDVGSNQDGQSDTFVRLNVSLLAGTPSPQEVQILFLSRLFIAWIQLRSKHPLLAARIIDGPTEPLLGRSSRRFEYDPNDSTGGGETFLVAKTRHGIARRMDEVQDQYILNGPRALLASDRCLARLVLVIEEDEPLKIGFFLVISHVISDGLSAFNLVNQLFETATSLNPPRQIPISAFCDFDKFVAGTKHQVDVAHTSDERASTGMNLSKDEILASLPLATEDHLPPLPLSSPSLHTAGLPTEAPRHHDAARSVPHSSPSPARRRWTWSITRVIILARQRRVPHSHHIPRKIPSPPPKQARTRWEYVRFDRSTSSKLFEFCKRNRQSPSMLLYSMLSLSTANLLNSLYPNEPYRPVLVGFPFSARRFLEFEPSRTPSSDPSSDLAIRITFGSIHLPNLRQDLDDDNEPNVSMVRTTVLRGARLAKRQFEERLRPDRFQRTIFLAAGYGLNLDRLLSRHGVPTIPWEDPKTCINASMIGDVDRILPARFQFSTTKETNDECQIRLHDLQIGTRLHLGEGLFNEGFTFDGMLQFYMGIDDQFMYREHVEAILNGIEKIGKLVAMGER